MIHNEWDCHKDITNYRDMINYAADHYAQNKGFSFYEGDRVVDITYKEFRDDVVALAGTLIKDGIKDNIIGMLCENDYMIIVTYFAFVISGNIMAMLNGETDRRTMNLILDNCRPVWMIYKSEFPICTYIEEERGEISCVPMREIEKRIAEGKTYLDECYRMVADMEINSEAGCTLLYTSGTTSEPKGVMSTQKGFVMNAKGLIACIDYRFATIMGLPLHHMYAWCCLVMPPILSGIDIFINAMPQYLTRDIMTANPGFMAIVPAVMRYYYRQIKRQISMAPNAEELQKFLEEDGTDTKSPEERHEIFREVSACMGTRLRYLMCGAASMEKEMSRFFDKIGITVLSAYGLTEYSSVASTERWNSKRCGSVGQATPHSELKIADPDSDGYGELCIRGAHTLGYYKKEKETREIFEDGWLRTGDLARLDEDGFLYIKGRIKNVIILGNGENVSAEEMEEYLYGISEIKEVVVYGENDLIAAEIYAEDISDRTKQKILEQIDLINEQLPSFKRIGITKFREKNFPKTATNKIKRMRRGECAQG